MRPWPRLLAVFAFLSCALCVPANAHARGATGSVPPAAALLAARLGVHTGPAALGNQSEGIGGPWTAWFSPYIGYARVRPFRDIHWPALFVGPQGGRGEFHYFNAEWLSEGGTDTNSVPAVSLRRAKTIALDFLRTSGAAIPPVPVHLYTHWRTTVVGGTGICCYHTITVVAWGGKVDVWGTPVGSLAMVYVADGGAVVQADVVPRGVRATRTHVHVCGSSNVDANGVVVGTFCFDYRAAAAATMTSDIGGHSPWRLDPAEMAFPTLGPRVNRQTVMWGSGRLIARTARRAVYQRTMNGVPYRMTLVPAFTGLQWTAWELVRVQRMRR